MRTILVDDSDYSLGILKELVEEAMQQEVQGAFMDPYQALGYAENHPIDLLMTDIEMPGMNGIELAIKLREKNPKLVVVFTTSYAGEYLEDLEKYADFFMMKPCTVGKVQSLLERAYYLSKRQEKRLKVSMIGPFAVVLDETIIKAKNAKARELLALCLDHRGGIVSREEAVDKLWPGREFDANSKKLVNKAENYIKKFFADRKMDNFFFTTHAGCYINTELVQCDYYDFIKENGLNTIPEGYLEDFEWAHEVLY